MATESKQTDSRWWEFYFVRYFVGTVVGGATLLYLNAEQGSSLRGLIIPGITDASGLDAQKLSLLLALGLAYCYVASAPVLVFHATRGVFLAATPPRAYRTSVVALLVTVLAVATLMLFAPSVSNEVVIVGAMFVLVFGFQTILLAFSLLDRGDLPHSYYLSLVRARSHDSEATRQYIESYKHLREHGNAFLILVFEVVLGIVLSAAPTSNVALIALLLWTVPGALVWAIGTLLEQRFTTTTPPP